MELFSVIIGFALTICWQVIQVALALGFAFFIFYGTINVILSIWYVIHKPSHDWLKDKLKNLFKKKGKKK